MTATARQKKMGDVNMGMIDLMKKGAQGAQDNMTIYRLYVAYSNDFYKIGQTHQALWRRFGRLRETEKSIKCLLYVEFTGTLSLALFVESATRLYMERIGYRHVKNDHYIRTGELDTFGQEALHIVTTTLNDLHISHKVIYKQAE